MNEYLSIALRDVADVYKMWSYLEEQDGKSFYARLVFSSIQKAINSIIVCILQKYGVANHSNDFRSNIITLRDCGYNTPVFTSIIKEYVNITAGSIYSVKSFETEPLVQKELLYAKDLCVSFMKEMFDTIEIKRECPDIDIMRYI